MSAYEGEAGIKHSQLEVCFWPIGAPPFVYRVGQNKAGSEKM
jgi:hypothetical protein